MRRRTILVRACALILLLLAASPLTFPFVTLDPAALAGDSAPPGAAALEPKSSAKAWSIALPASGAGAAPAADRLRPGARHDLPTAPSRTPLRLVLRI